MPSLSVVCVPTVVPDCVRVIVTPGTGTPVPKPLSSTLPLMEKVVCALAGVEKDGKLATLANATTIKAAAYQPALVGLLIQLPFFHLTARLMVRSFDVHSRKRRLRHAG